MTSAENPNLENEQFHFIPNYPVHATQPSLQYQIDVDEIINEIEHNLKGEKICFDSDTNQLTYKKIQNVRPCINDEGLMSVIMILKSRLTKIFILSNLDESAIYNMTTYVGENCISMLHANWERYEIPDTASASMIVETITDTVFATLNKAKNGQYLRFLTHTQQTQEVRKYGGSEGSAGQDEGSIIHKLLQKKGR